MFDGIVSGAAYRLGNFGVADSLRQIDAANFFALHRHDANLRLHDAGAVLAEREHLMILPIELVASPERAAKTHYGDTEHREAQYKLIRLFNVELLQPLRGF